METNFDSLIDGTLKRTNKYAKTQQLDENQTLELGLCILHYFYLVMSTELNSYQVLRQVSDFLIEKTSQRKLRRKEVFILEEVQTFSKFFVASVLVHHSIFCKLLRTRKELQLSTFKVFRRKSPFDMPLNSGEEVTNPLAIPFLRDAILQEGEFYFTDEEVMKIIDNDRIGEYEGEERKFLEKRAAQIQRERLIRKVMDLQVSKLKKEIDGELKVVTDIVK